MSETQYSEAAVEVLDILNHTNEEDIARIPQSFIKFLTDISSKSYKTKFNHEQPINGFNLRKQTKELLGFIYITWWCNKEEQEKYKNIIHENNIKKEKIKEIYDVNDILKNRNMTHQAQSKIVDSASEPCCLHNKKEKNIIQNESVVETNMIEYQKENRLKKVLNKILSFFGSKKERG